MLLHRYLFGLLNMILFHHISFLWLQLFYTLPMFHQLTADNVEYITEQIKHFYEQN